MAASIGRALQDGFHAANRSWSGIGFFAGSWIIVAIVGAVLVLVTQPPPAVFENPPGEPSSEEQAPELPPAPPAPTASATPEASPAPAGASADNTRMIEAWFGRAWPLLLIALLLFIAANVWLTAGQIAYLVKRVTSGSTRLAEFWTTGRQAFASLLGAWCLAIFGVGALALGLALLGFLMSAIGGAAPRWLSAVLGALLGVALFAAMVWLAVRLLFWFIAVVMDRLGPIAGLQASWRATRGRWWRVAGLGLAVIAISFLVSAAFGLIEWAGGQAGALGPVLVLISNVAGIVANLYVGFWVTGAFVRYYADVKANASSASSAPVSA